MRRLGCRRADEPLTGQVRRHRERTVGHLRQRHHACPAAGVARQRPAEQAEIQEVLHVCRRQHRDAEIAERELAGVGQRGRLAAVVVAYHQQHATEGAGAGGIGVAQRIGGAIEARRLAVPHAEYALVSSAREQSHLLAAPHRGGRQVLVDAGLKHHAVAFELGGETHKLLVEAAERRAAVARDEAGGVVAGLDIQTTLVQEQAGERLDAGEIGDAALVAVAARP